MINQIRQSADQKLAGYARFLGVAIMLGCALGGATNAAAQLVTPKTPTIITPPEGATAFLVGHAKGTQGYVCLPTSPGASTASWTINSARPEATLFSTFFGNDVQIITHFASPDAKPNKFAPSTLPGAGNATWQSSFDSSRIWAAVLHGNILPASADQSSCPNTGSIPCLLLQSIGNDKGPTGGRLFADTTFVQRLNTNGGAAPANGCAVSSDVGKQKLVPYTADYYFFRGGVSLD